MKIDIVNNPKMQGLIIKEILQLKSYKKTLISLILIFSLMAIIQFLGSGVVGLFQILPVIITIGFGIYSIASFNYDEVAKADRYIRTLPISKKEIVLSKYIFIISAIIIGASIGMILTNILSLIFANGEIFMNIIEVLVVTLGGILGISIVEAIQIPCIYKFGAEKARMQIFLIILVLLIGLTLIIGGIIFWLEKWNINISNIECLIPLILMTLIIIIYNISYKIAYKIYEKKEF